MVKSPSPSVQELTDAARQLLASRDGVVAAYLFGSAARGVADPADLVLIQPARAKPRRTALVD